MPNPINGVQQPQKLLESQEEHVHVKVEKSEESPSKNLKRIFDQTSENEEKNSPNEKRRFFCEIPFEGQDANDYVLNSKNWSASNKVETDEGKYDSFQIQWTPLNTLTDNATTRFIRSLFS